MAAKKSTIKEKTQPLMIPSGSTLLNLGMSGTIEGAWACGYVHQFSGGTGSGKSFISMSIFAECANSPKFDNHDFFYDDIENGCQMDLGYLFDENTASRIKPPTDKGPSRTVEDFYYTVTDKLKESEESGRPFIYVLDSEDALTTDADNAKFDDQKKAHQAGRATTGSFGMAKAKLHANCLKRVVTQLEGTDSAIFFIKQIRDNIEGMYKKHKTTGGLAIPHMVSTDVWTSVVKEIKKSVKGKQRTIGIEAKCKSEKNRQTGRLMTIPTRIYYDYGIDNIGANIDWLMEEGLWKGSKSSIGSQGFHDGNCKWKDMVKYIEDNDLEADLDTLVLGLWNEIEEGKKLGRKPRYGKKVKE